MAAELLVLTTCLPGKTPLCWLGEGQGQNTTNPYGSSAKAQQFYKNRCFSDCSMPLLNFHTTSVVDFLSILFNFIVYFLFLFFSAQNFCQSPFFATADFYWVLFSDLSICNFGAFFFRVHMTFVITALYICTGTGSPTWPCRRHCPLFLPVAMSSPWSLPTVSFQYAIPDCGVTS